MNKHIEEMARDICRRELEPNCATCYFQDKNCRDLILSEKLYNAGYRKASDVVADVLVILNELKEDYLAEGDVRKACGVRYAAIKITELKDENE